MGPGDILRLPGLAVRALDDLHRIAQLGDRLADLSSLSRNVEALSRSMASVERRLEAIEGFGADLDRLGVAARELTRTMVLLRKTTENVTVNVPGSALIARRASRRRAAARDRAAAGAGREDAQEAPE